MKNAQARIATKLLGIAVCTLKENQPDTSKVESSTKDGQISFKGGMLITEATPRFASLIGC